MRKPTLKVHPYKHSKTHKFYINLRAFGEGRKFFRTRAEAEAARLRLITTLNRHGDEALALSRHEISDFITARKKLAEYGESITDAVKFRVDHLERVRRCKITVGQLSQEVIEAKRKDGCSAKYLVGLKSYYKRFGHDFGNRLIAGITVEELDNWLRAIPGSPQTRMDYRTFIGVLFSYATKRRMIDSNPVLHTARPKLINKAPEIFTVDELRALLETAQRTEPRVLPMLAIGAFAGLREAEIRRLAWSEIDLVRGFIEVTSAKAKSARRRIIPIQSNLAAWLRPYASMQGLVVPKGARRKLKRVRREARLLKWPRNGLRHSFASYRLAAIQDAPRVSAELGHTSPQLLYNTYREVVRPEDAKLYWEIAPAIEAEKVVAFSQGQ
jgi:integrase